MANIEEKLWDILKEIKALRTTDQRLPDGDYVENGLIHCGKCREPKEAIVAFFGKVPCMCKCESDAYRQEEERRKEEEHRITLQNKRGYCFDSVAMCNYTFEKCTAKDDPLYDVALQYAKNFSEMLRQGEGLTFFGNLGTGKTYFAASIANDVIDQGYTARMTNFSTIDSEIRNGDASAYIKELMKNDLLIIDDLDAERSSEYMQETVHNIIDRRHTTRKPLIVTTNLTSKELKSRDDKAKSRIYSRLMDMTLPIEFNGEDMREENLRQKYARLKGLLHLPDKKKGTQ